jgi:hypothetical protein
MAATGTQVMAAKLFELDGRVALVTDAEEVGDRVGEAVDGPRRAFR